MAISRSPWMGSVTLADTNVHKLTDLLAALGADAPVTPASGVLRAQLLFIANDIDNGAPKIYVGNENVSTSFYGYKTVAGTAVTLQSLDANLLRLDQIYLLSDTANAVVSIVMVTR